MNLLAPPSGRPDRIDLTSVIEVGVHGPCPGRQASRMGPPHGKRWSPEGHPGRGHRPGHLLSPLPATARRRATWTGRTKHTVNAVAARIGALPDVAGPTLTFGSIGQTPTGSVRPAGSFMRLACAGSQRPFPSRSRARTDRFGPGPRPWTYRSSTRRWRPARDAAVSDAEMCGPQLASTQRRSAVVSCGDQRVRLDPAHGGERRCPPPHTAAHAMDGDPAHRHRTSPGRACGAPAATGLALGGSPIGGWPW
jgi:hypothetical protein